MHNQTRAQIELGNMQLVIRKGLSNPEVRKYIAEVTGNIFSGNPGEIDRELLAIFRGTVGSFIYTPNKKAGTGNSISEFIRSRRGDCDDFTAYFSALLKLYGQRVFLKAVRTPTSNYYNHVYPILLLTGNRYLVLDAGNNAPVFGAEVFYTESTLQEVLP